MADIQYNTEKIKMISEEKMLKALNDTRNTIYKVYKKQLINDKDSNRAGAFLSQVFFMDFSKLKGDEKKISISAAQEAQKKLIQTYWKNGLPKYIVADSKKGFQFEEDFAHVLEQFMTEVSVEGAKYATDYNVTIDLNELDKGKGKLERISETVCRNTIRFWMDIVDSNGAALKASTTLNKILDSFMKDGNINIEKAISHLYSKDPNTQEFVKTKVNAFQGLKLENTKLYVAGVPQKTDVEIKGELQENLNMKPEDKKWLEKFQDKRFTLKNYKDFNITWGKTKAETIYTNIMGFELKKELGFEKIEDFIATLKYMETMGYKNTGRTGKKDVMKDKDGKVIKETLDMDDVIQKIKYRDAELRTLYDITGVGQQQKEGDKARDVYAQIFALMHYTYDSKYIKIIDLKKLVDKIKEGSDQFSNQHIVDIHDKLWTDTLDIHLSVSNFIN